MKIYRGYMKILAIMIVLMLPFLGFATDWDLSGIDIIDREEWGAEENWKYIESGRYDSAIERYEAYEKWLAGEGPERDGFEARKRSQEKNAIRRAFLEENFPEEIQVDEVIETEGEEKTLIWEHEIVNDKRKIVIHHTADAFNIQTKQDAIEAMQYFYELHTLKKGWGDIGYHFLIDPFGNIYEGKSGGEGVVGAHADWNNTSTIGIALMGNYEKKEPTEAMLRALVDLSVSLGYKYEISPMEEMPYFTAINEIPYLEVSYHDAIVGHKDTKVTACPGEHVYEKIPTIKENIMKRMQRLAENGVHQLDDQTLQTREEPFVLDGEKGVVWFDITEGGASSPEKEVTCRPMTPGMRTGKCVRVGNKVVMPIEYTGPGSSGMFTVGIGFGVQSRIQNFGVLWKEELDEMRMQRRMRWLSSNSLPNTTANEKSVVPISITQAKESIDDELSVLLYELTAEYDAREFRCEGTCIAMVGGDRIEIEGSITVMRHNENPDALRIFTNGTQTSASAFGIQAKPGSMIEVANYDRETGGFPLNLFRGTLTVTKQPWTHLDGSEEFGYVVMNTLPFDEYMLGIGEGSERQHTEKLRTLAILAKQYALWYTAGQNVHPSIPDGAKYQAIDDARFFQRYVGAGWESYAKRWAEAIRDTKDVLVSYDNTLPILPYFHCSAGFTLSGEEKRGWTDTPWLDGAVDPLSCASGGFEGHGVGLSGDGAEAMAQAGASYEQILQRFYEGIELVE